MVFLSIKEYALKVPCSGSSCRFFKRFAKSFFREGNLLSQPRFPKKEEHIENVVDELKAIFKKHLIAIRPHSSNQRNGRNYQKRLKPKVNKSHKNVL